MTGRVGAGKSVVEWSWLAEVVDDSLHRAEPAFPRTLDQGFGHLNRRSGRARPHDCQFGSKIGVTVSAKWLRGVSPLT
jgi:hypothetical protein